MRQIVCPAHGKVRPLHAEDVQRGITQRYVSGTTRASLVCDVCDVPLPAGSPAVAITTMAKGRPIGDWEGEYLALRATPAVVS